MSAIHQAGAIHKIENQRNTIQIQHNTEAKQAHCNKKYNEVRMQHIIAMQYKYSA